MLVYKKNKKINDLSPSQAKPYRKSHHFVYEIIN